MNYSHISPLNALRAHLSALGNVAPVSPNYRHTQAPAWSPQNLSDPSAALFGFGAQPVYWHPTQASLSLNAAPVDQQQAGGFSSIPQGMDGGEGGASGGASAGSGDGADGSGSGPGEGSGVGMASGGMVGPGYTTQMPLGLAGMDGTFAPTYSTQSGGGGGDNTLAMLGTLANIASFFI